MTANIPNNRADYSGLPCGRTAYTIASCDLEAVFLPGCGMLGVSLRHQGVELLRRLDGLEAAAVKGSTAGIPLLHPWANRLAGTHYSVVGRTVELDASSPLLHVDENGLPIHGVPWAKLAWEATDVRQDHLAARLDWTRGDLLAIFPFQHRLEIVATIRDDGLTIETTLTAGHSSPVPVCFGFHPYFGLPDLPRAEWRLELPAMRRLLLDRHGIPTGEEQPFAGFAGPLGDDVFDDGFAVLDQRPSFSLTGAGRQITVEFLAGYPYAQIFAPKGKEFVAIEPMTARTNALASGRGLKLVEPGEKFRTAFRIGAEEIA